MCVIGCVRLCDSVGVCVWGGAVLALSLCMCVSPPDYIYSLPEQVWECTCEMPKLPQEVLGSRSTLDQVHYRLIALSPTSESERW